MIPRSADIETFRADVIKAREELGVSPTALAQEAGVTKKVVLNLERGETRQIRQQTCKRLCDALGLDPWQYMDMPLKEEDESQGEEAPDPEPKLRSTGPSLEIQLEDAKCEVNELRDALNRKNVQYQEVVRRADGLQAQVDEDDCLIMYLLSFVGRLIGGDVKKNV